MNDRTRWALAAVAVIGMLGVVAWVIQDDGPSLDDELAAVISSHGLEPIDANAAQPAALVELGEALFWDKELSGNRDIACATCHHTTLGSGDALPVSIGTGGSGLGEQRVLGEGRNLVPRNAPDVWNRGADGFFTMFWDGRVSGTAEHGFTSPAGEQLPAGLPNVLAVQAMFPVTSADEMRGVPGDVDVFGNVNELGEIADDDFSAIWDGLMERVVAIPRYVELFEAAYPDTPTDHLGFEHAAMAIAAFETNAFAADQTPWDRYLAGHRDAMDDAAKRGALLFYGTARCAACHSGDLLTDQQHHNIGAPQVGPGKGEEAPDDHGRARETGSAMDMYAFRTPPLRNVTANGPYFHDGAYMDLEAAVRHHLDVLGSLAAYDVAQLRDDLELEYTDPSRTAVVVDYLDPRLATPRLLSETEIDDLMAFLEALTDPRLGDVALRIPDAVPSGLPIDRSE
ncbi:MAG TPA: cytochrome c peroxidase [Acidimicrobiia bacterium]|nr:cytochrome c peroxidase [Acidimicrobiia bacterium]